MKQLTVAATLALLTSGCASLGNFNTAFRTNELEPNEAAFIDAQQRVILSNQRHGAQRVVCAEPGPDVFSARSASLSGNAQSNDQFAAGLAAATGESAGAVSAPTTAILSQRHAYYRICEAYMNGASDEIDVMLGIRNNQRILAGLLAIEQLTGAVRAAPTVLSSAGSATTGQILSQLSSSRASEVTRRAQSEASRGDLTRQYDDADRRVKEIDLRLGQSEVPADEQIRIRADKALLQDRMGRLERERTQIAETIASSDAIIRALDEGIRAAREGGASTLSVGVTLNPSGATISDGTAQHISAAIVDIVRMMNEQDYGPTTCLAIMRRERYTMTRELEGTCQSILATYIGGLSASAVVRTALASSVQSIVDSARTSGRQLTDAEANLIGQILRHDVGPAPVAAAPSN